MSPECFAPRQPPVYHGEEGGLFLVPRSRRASRSRSWTPLNPTMAITHISVRGARQHNLRDINVRIPRNTLTVVTGLSGSGKSSLAFDTIYAEGQRRYV